MKSDRVSALGVVSIIGEDHKPVEIRSYSAIYHSIGATAARLAEWQELYGMDSLGVGNEGEYLAPGFPVLSKVAWMFVDPVDLTFLETQALISECEVAMTNANDAGAKEELAQIKMLAQSATDTRRAVRFAHP